MSNLVKGILSGRDFCLEGKLSGQDSVQKGFGYTLVLYMFCKQEDSLYHSSNFDWSEIITAQ